MARISNRFENPNGRAVPTVPARLSGTSCTFAEHTRMSGNPKCEGIGLQLRTEDGRTLWVKLTHAELDALNNDRAAWDAKYGRP